MTRVEQEHEWLFQALERFMDNELSSAETALVAEHLAECPPCQQRLAEWRGVERTFAAHRMAVEPSLEYQKQLVERLRTASAPRRYDLVSESEIETLTAFHSDTFPVVSLYLDVRPAERQGDKLRAKLKALMEDAERQLQNAPEARQRALRHELERLQQWFQFEYDQTGRGLALFASSEPGLWRVFRLPAPVRDQIIVAERPYLRPLLTLMDEYERYLVVLVDKQTARLFVVYMGEIQEYDEFDDELVPHPKAGGWSAEKYQRHHDMHVLWHVKHAVEAAEQLWRREHCDWLLVGGTPEPLAELRAHLPKALNERMAGELALSLKATPDQVLTQVRQLENANEGRIETERVEALITAALGNGPGVLGLDDTLGALVEGNVMTLVVEEDFHQPGWECPNCQFLSAVAHSRCPLCGMPLDARVDIVERAVERAFEQHATIEIVRSPVGAKLAAYGHIGALLRFQPTSG
jgi:peptide chain release factor subunit 1